MDATAFEALRVTLLVACGATVLATPPAFVLGYWLARYEFRGKSLVETLVTLPLVLPPTAIGYLLLKLLGLGGPLGRDVLGFDLDLLFTWKGAVIAAAVMSLPLITRTARVAFEAVPERLELMGASLGHSRLTVWRRITLPLAGRGLVAAAFLGLARATGEFGATVIIAGNIPGETQTLSLAIFSDLNAHRDAHAWLLVGLTITIAFALVWCVESLSRRRIT